MNISTLLSTAWIYHSDLRHVSKYLSVTLAPEVNVFCVHSIISIIIFQKYIYNQRVVKSLSSLFASLPAFHVTLASSDIFYSFFSSLNPQTRRKNIFAWTWTRRTKKYMKTKSDFYLFHTKGKTFYFFVCLHHETGEKRNNKTIKQLKLYNFSTDKNIRNAFLFLIQFLKL